MLLCKMTMGPGYFGTYWNWAVISCVAYQAKQLVLIFVSGGRYSSCIMHALRKFYKKSHFFASFFCIICPSNTLIFCGGLQGKSLFHQTAGSWIPSWDHFCIKSCCQMKYECMQCDKQKQKRTLLFEEKFPQNVKNQQKNNAKWKPVQTRIMSPLPLIHLSSVKKLAE